MESYWYFYLFAIALVVLELFTSTFYLLAVAVGLFCGGLIAGLTGNTINGVVAASFATVALVIIVAKYRSKKVKELTPLDSNNIDAGGEVTIIKWNEDGSALVNYRGTEWSARPASANMVQGNKAEVVMLSGNTLLIKSK